MYKSSSDWASPAGGKNLPAQPRHQHRYSCSFCITIHESFVFLRKFPAVRSGVAQICNLLYRRIAFGGAPGVVKSFDPAAASGLQIRDTAEYHSALLRLRLRLLRFFAASQSRFLGCNGTGLP